MGTEIERKYLVDLRALADSCVVQESDGHRLQQGYLSTGGNGFDEMRVRIENDEKATVTFKSKGDLTRSESEFPVDMACARRMLHACVGVVLDKVRFRVPAGNGLTFEVDIYHGDLSGLAVAEIELPTEDTAVDLPSWIAQEITFDKRYKNAALAVNGRPEPDNELDSAPRRPRMR